MIAARVAVAALALLVSCGTIMNPGPDMVPISSQPPGAKIILGGNVVGTTPMVVPVPRSAGKFNSFGAIRGAFIVELKLVLDGYKPETVTIEDEPNVWTFGNLLIGGLVGTLVDVCTYSTSQWCETPVMVKLVESGGGKGHRAAVSEGGVGGGHR